MSNKLLDTHKAAEHLGDIQPNTLEGWRVKGIGPKFIKIGRLVRYRTDDLDQWLQAQTRSSTSQAPQNAEVVA